MAHIVALSRSVKNPREILNHTLSIGVRVIFTDFCCHSSEPDLRLLLRHIVGSPWLHSCGIWGFLCKSERRKISHFKLWNRLWRLNGSLSVALTRTPSMDNYRQVSHEKLSLKRVKSICSSRDRFFWPRVRICHVLLIRWPRPKTQPNNRRSFSSLCNLGGAIGIVGPVPPECGAILFR